VPNVQWKTPDDGQRNCPKHVEFRDKNKFGKISASVGFIKKQLVTMQHGHRNVKPKFVLHSDSSNGVYIDTNPHDFLLTSGV